MKGLGEKSDPLGQTARYWRDHSKQVLHSEKETRRRRSLSLDRGHEGRIREVLQEDGCSSMYKSQSCILTCTITVCSLNMSCDCLYPGTDSR